MRLNYYPLVGGVYHSSKITGLSVRITDIGHKSFVVYRKINGKPQRIIMSKNTHIQLSSFTHKKFYPWLVIFLCASLLFYKYILNVSPSIMVPELMEQFHLNGTQLGNLAAMFFYTYTIVQIFSGILLDRFSARWLAGTSILISAAGAYLFASTSSLWVAQVARGMMGFGIAFATVTYLKMTTMWFKPEQSAFVGGLLATAVMLGALFGEAPLANLLQHTSWRFVLWFCASLGLIIAILFILLIRDKTNIIPSTSFSNKSNAEQGFSWAKVLTVLSNKQNWLLTLYSGLAFAPLSVLCGLWGNPFIQEVYHISRTETAALVSFSFVGFGVGGPFFGLLSDRLGKRIRVMKIGVLLSLVSLCFILYSPPMPIILLSCLLFLFGLGVGAFMLGFTVGTQSNTLPLAATVIALINTGDSIFESFTDPLIGKFLDLHWDGKIVNGMHYFSVHNYHHALLPLPLYLAVALVVLFFIKEPTGRMYTPHL